MCLFVTSVSELELYIINKDTCFDVGLPMLGGGEGGGGCCGNQHGCFYTAVELL
jgi:hypothetical protein